MISDGSCDTEDWNNAENYLLKYIEIENGYFKL